VKHPLTYVLIADGSQARLLSSKGLGKPLTEVTGGAYHHDLKPDHELQSDRPGRVHESANVSRHAIEREDLHRKEKQKFATELAEVLDARFGKDEFQRLVIVAPPEALGFIRNALSDKVRDAILGELAKDLTKMTNTEIHAQLAKDLPL
jgi:protein required for attachment to host cells